MPMIKVVEKAQMMDGHSAKWYEVLFSKVFLRLNAFEGVSRTAQSRLRCMEQWGGWREMSRDSHCQMHQKHGLGVSRRWMDVEQ